VCRSVEASDEGVPAGGRITRLDGASKDLGGRDGAGCYTLWVYLDVHGVIHTGRQVNQIANRLTKGVAGLLGATDALHLHPAIRAGF
jgi:hypothetical protein